jgi:hypothetical protein
MTVPEKPAVIADFTPAQIAAFRAAFRSGDPFAHLVIDDFLAPRGEDLETAFPDPQWPHWALFQGEYQKQKRHCDDVTVIPPPLARVIEACRQPAILDFLEKITGIDKLIPDPHLDGGGLHMSGPGGVLAPHTDFHLYKRLDLYRQINLLIYLNHGWTADDGGNLELYAKGRETPAISVTPAYGRAVIFKTDHNSVHGFRNPVAPGKWRKSIALYYYTATESGAFSGDTVTHWRSHAKPLTGIRQILFKFFTGVSHIFSNLAYLFNPNKRR